MNIDIQTLDISGKPLAIPQLSLPATLKILVLAPHPDDFDAIGVTLRFLSRNGNTINVGVARTGSGVEDAYLLGLTLEGKADLREREQRRSLEFFGLPENCLTFLPMLNDSGHELYECSENYLIIKSFVMEKKPDIIFLPHGNDTNTAHQAMHSLLRHVAQQSGATFSAFLNRDVKTIDMRTDVYMPFGQDEAEWKAELLRFHDSQHQRNLRLRGHGFDDRILDENRTAARDLALNHNYAESFEIEHHNMAKK